MTYARLSLAIGIALIVIGIAEMVRPFGPAFFRANPVLVVIIGALFTARYAVRTAALRRRRMIDEVPKRPLGIADED